MEARKGQLTNCHTTCNTPSHCCATSPTAAPSRSQLAHQGRQQCPSPPPSPHPSLIMNYAAQYKIPPLMSALMPDPIHPGLRVTCSVTGVQITIRGEGSILQTIWHPWRAADAELLHYVGSLTCSVGVTFSSATRSVLERMSCSLLEQYSILQSVESQVATW